MDETTKLPELHRLAIPSYIDLINPEFDKNERVHDWRNHVPSEIKELWPQLSMETRLAIAFMAEEIASNEEWD